MTNIIVVLPKIEDARGIRSVLMKNGIPVSAVCSTGAQTLNHLRDLNDGIVICGYKMTDMLYIELHQCLPPGFDMLLLASRTVLNDCLDNDIIKNLMFNTRHDRVAGLGNSEGSQRALNLLYAIRTIQERNGNIPAIIEINMIHKTSAASLCPVFFLFFFIYHSKYRQLLLPVTLSI